MCIVWWLWWPPQSLECSAIPRGTPWCCAHFLKPCIGSKRCCCCLFIPGLLALTHMKGIKQRATTAVIPWLQDEALYCLKGEIVYCCGTVCTSVTKSCSVTLIPSDWDGLCIQNCTDCIKFTWNHGMPGRSASPEPALRKYLFSTIRNEKITWK